MFNKLGQLILSRASPHLFLLIFSTETAETAAAGVICRRMKWPKKVVMKHCYLCFILLATSVLWALLAEK